MKYGLYLPNFGPLGDPRTVAAWAAEAEESGWDGFFLWDHVARPWDVDVVDPWVALAAVATATRKIRLGALVTPIPRRRPWKLARETVSLDRLSGGRLVVGVGSGSAGGVKVEWSSFGEEMDPKRRGAMLDEGLEVLTGLWRGEPYSFSGVYYQVEEARFKPVPLQSPRIPIWIGVWWPNRRPLRRAARFDGVFPLFPEEGDELTRLRQVGDYVKKHRTTKDPFDLVYLHRPPGQAPATAALEQAGVTWQLEQMNPQNFGGDWTRWPVDAMLAHLRRGPLLS